MRHFLLVLALPFGLLAACRVPAYVPRSQEHRAVVYAPGVPDFDMEAVATLRDGQPGLDVFAGIPYASLAFVKQDSVFRAVYELFAHVVAGEERVREAAWRDTVAVGDYDATRSLRRATQVERLELPPGRYVVELVLEDGSSDARAVRRQEVTVFAPEAGQAEMSGVRLVERRGGAAPEPVLALHVPAGSDSLRAVAEVYEGSAAATVELVLVRFASDTSAAAPPYWHTPAPFSLAYMGVDYGEVDTVQHSRRSLGGADAAVVVEFALPALERGIYEARMTLRKAGAGGAVRRRFFTVRSPDFPRVTSLAEMVDALAYIATEREMRHLRAAGSPAELRRRFDAFWAARVPDRQAAAALLKSYYERVEEANLLYSSHKEGWKTDAGMLYVVLGPPAYTDETFQRRAWYYFEGLRQLPVYVFRRASAFGTDTLFDHYVLQRGPGHELPFARAVDRWREGRPY